MERGKGHKETFGLYMLPKMFPGLRAVSHHESVLATIFDGLCWQIRLMLLNPHSIHRIGTRTWYYHEDHQYRIIDRIGPAQMLACAHISFQMISVNRRGYGELQASLRESLPDRGVMPPHPMWMTKNMVIEGDEILVRSIHEQFSAFPGLVHGQRKLLGLLKRFARERLIDQPYAHLALLEGVARYYEICGDD